MNASLFHIMTSLPCIFYAFALFMHRLHTYRIGGGHSSRVHDRRGEEPLGVAS